jgi:hypothetical protein
MDTLTINFNQKCWKCNGTKIKPNKQECKVCDKQTRQLKHKPLRPFKTKVEVGPKAKYEMDQVLNTIGKEEMLCSLCGSWCIYALEYGHRMTTDDVLTAAVAIKHLTKNMINIKTHLDIGTGLGTVLNLIHWFYFNDNIKSCGIEAQKVHVNLCVKTCEFNGILDRCEIHHLDLREITKFKKYDLVTGTPPYFPSKNGSLPNDLGRSMCAFELRGGWNSAN